MFFFHSRFRLVCLLPAFLFVVDIGINPDIGTPSIPLEKSIQFRSFFPSESRPTDSSTFILPFSRAGNLILVQAKVDTIEGNFILDTGCPNLVLNLTYFRHYPTTFDQEAEKTGVTGSIPSVVQTLVKKFSLGTSEQYRVEADLVNLGHIENSKGVKVLGLLGMDILKQFELIIDYEKNLLYFHQLKRKGYSQYQHVMLMDNSAYYTVPIELLDNRVIVRTEMAGKRIRMVVDTGAECNILDSRLPDRVFENVLITGRTILSGAGNKKVEVLQGDLKNMRMGNQLVSKLPVIVTNLEKTCFSISGCADGVLGFDFLSLQKIGFNFVNQKMYIWK